jgi:hypothetical protein
MSKPKRKSLRRLIREAQGRRPSLDEMKCLWNEVICQQGYLVLGTKTVYEPMKLGEIVTSLWEYPIDQPFRVIGFTDRHEYDTQIDLFQSLRPSWPRMAKAGDYDGGNRFYRVATD